MFSLDQSGRVWDWLLSTACLWKIRGSAQATTLSDIVGTVSAFAQSAVSGNRGGFFVAPKFGAIRNMPEMLLGRS